MSTSLFFPVQTETGTSATGRPKAPTPTPGCGSRPRGNRATTTSGSGGGQPTTPSRSPSPEPRHAHQATHARTHAIAFPAGSQRATATANVTSTPARTPHAPRSRLAYPSLVRAHREPSRAEPSPTGHGHALTPPGRERRAHAVYGASAIRRRSKREASKKASRGHDDHDHDPILARPPARLLRLYAAPATAPGRSLAAPSGSPSRSVPSLPLSVPSRPLRRLSHLPPATNQGPPARRRWCMGGGRARTPTPTTAPP